MPTDPFDRAAPVPHDEPAAEPLRAADDDADAIRRSAIAAGRRRGGAAGAALAGAMLAVRDVLEGPTKEEIPIEVEASGEPHDVDRDGVRVDVDGVAVEAPALERRAPLTATRSRRR